jgi:hypothetical protein
MLNSSIHGVLINHIVHNNIDEHDLFINTEKQNYYITMVSQDPYICSTTCIYYSKTEPTKIFAYGQNPPKMEEYMENNYPKVPNLIEDNCSK